MAIYHAYIRSHVEGKTGRILERMEPTRNVKLAESAYRRLLARDDLAGQPIAAVLSSSWVPGKAGGSAIYYSRFDDPDRRIPPNAPLDLKRRDDGTEAALTWHRLTAATNWEIDPRPFATCLRAWRIRHGWGRVRAAAELRVSQSTHDRWCAGQVYNREAAILRLMTMIDQKSPTP